MKSLITTTTDFVHSNSDELIVQSLAKLDQLALGISTGTLIGLIIFLATNWLVIKGGNDVGSNLILLNQYFVGYEVTFKGSLIGLFYGFVAGFVLGWLVAFLRNIAIKIYFHSLKLKNSMSAVNDFVDHI